MIPDAYGLADRYSQLSCPVAILAGDAEAVVDLNVQARRLHAEVPGSTLDVLAGIGHMTHHADPARIVRAIDSVGGADWPNVKMSVRATSAA